MARGGSTISHLYGSYIPHISENPQHRSVDRSRYKVTTQDSHQLKDVTTSAMSTKADTVKETQIQEWKVLDAANQQHVWCRSPVPLARAEQAPPTVRNSKLLHSGVYKHRPAAELHSAHGSRLPAADKMSPEAAVAAGLCSPSRGP